MNYTIQSEIDRLVKLLEYDYIYQFFMSIKYQKSWAIELEEYFINKLAYDFHMTYKKAKQHYDYNTHSAKFFTIPIKT